MQNHYDQNHEQIYHFLNLLTTSIQALVGVVSLLLILRDKSESLFLSGPFSSSFTWPTILVFFSTCTSCWFSNIIHVSACLGPGWWFHQILILDSDAYSVYPDSLIAQTWYCCLAIHSFFPLQWHCDPNPPTLIQKDDVSSFTI